MSTLNIEIETDNAAFDDNEAAELARILLELAHNLTYYGPMGIGENLRDINGNTVGHVRYLGEEK